MEEINKSKEINLPGLCPLISKRWSPRAFADKEVEPEKAKLLFQAAQWTASSYNEQPWRFVVGDKKSSPETYERILKVLVEFNQSWASSAPILVLTFSSTKFAQNNKDNSCARYDCGQAAASLSIQATFMGLYVHQMGGLDYDRAKSEFNVPEDFVCNSAMAIGYLGELDRIPEGLRDMEKTERVRKPLSEFVFVNKWGEGFTK